jgi:hypothetical protein
MRRALLTRIVIAAIVAVASGQSDADQVKVNIAYPIDGATYPVMNPGPPALSSLYFTASFSVTCGGGPHKAEWGFDASPSLGAINFYDQTTLQFVHKLPGGTHSFWVTAANCGRNQVKFRIGH